MYGLNGSERLLSVIWKNVHASCSKYYVTPKQQKLHSKLKIWTSTFTWAQFWVSLLDLDCVWSAGCAGEHRTELSCPADAVFIYRTDPRVEFQINILVHKSTITTLNKECFFFSTWMNFNQLPKYKHTHFFIILYSLQFSTLLHKLTVG